MTIFFVGIVVTFALFLLQIAGVLHHWIWVALPLIVALLLGLGAVIAAFFVEMFRKR